MTSNLMPCPCCGGKPMEMQYDGILWVQCEDCALNTAACDASADYVQLWNRRATQPAAGEPIGKVELFGINMTYVEWRERKMPPLGTELYAAPPAAAHGDEAVRKDAARYQALRNTPEIFIGVAEGDDMVFLKSPDQLDQLADNAVAMRAQGDGGEA